MFTEVKKNADMTTTNLLSLLRHSPDLESRAFCAVMLRKVCARPTLISACSPREVHNISDSIPQVLTKDDPSLWPQCTPNVQVCPRGRVSCCPMHWAMHIVQYYNVGCRLSSGQSCLTVSKRRRSAPLPRRQAPPPLRCTAGATCRSPCKQGSVHVRHSWQPHHVSNASQQRDWVKRTAQSFGQHMWQPSSQPYSADGPFVLVADESQSAA